MDSPTPGGTFFALPRELRDQIYGYALSHRYLVYGTSFWDPDDLRKAHSPKVPADVGILLSSKVIREEALRILFNHTVFRFAVQPSVNFNSHILYSSPNGAAPKVQIPAPVALFLTENIMKIDMVFNMALWYDCECMFPVNEKDMEKMCHCSSINAWTGTEKARDTFHMTFYSFAADGVSTIINTPFFQAIKDMKGFKRLVVQVDTYHAHKYALLDDAYGVMPRVKGVDVGGQYEDGHSCYNSLIPDRILHKEMKQWLGEQRYEEMYADGERFLDDIRKELVPVLGPCTEGDVPEACNVAFSRFLEFRPREHHVKNLRTETARLI